MRNVPDVCGQLNRSADLKNSDGGPISSPLLSALFLLYLALFIVWVYRWELRTWIFLIVSLAFLPSLLRKDRPTSSTKSPATVKGIRWRFDFRSALLVTGAALALYLAVGYFGGRGFTPHMHDEFAYIFQAKMFEHGRVTFPPPPIPEFFESFHILTENVYASKYPPGHALVMLPGVLLGFPMLMPIALSGGSLLLVYLIMRKSGGDQCGLLCLGLFALSPLQVMLATSHLSHTSSLFFLLLFVYFSACAKEQGRRFFASASGVALGIAFLVRPVTAVAFAFPFVISDLFASVNGLRKREREGLKNFLASSIPFVSIAGLLLAYNLLVTGDLLKFPWVEYTNRYIPLDTLGFQRDSQIASQHNLSPLMTEFNRNYVEPLRRAYSFWGAVKQFWVQRIPDTLYASDDTFGLAALVPFAFLVPLTSQERLFLASTGSLLLAYFFYYGGFPRYHFEVVPFLIYFFIKGTSAFCRILPRGGRRLLLRFLIFHLMSGAIVALPYNLLNEFSSKRHFTKYHAEFRELVQKLDSQSKLIFVRYKSDHPYHYDLINNEPDLKTSKIIYVHDMGERNRDLMKLFPGRDFYRFDEAAWKIERLAD